MPYFKASYNENTGNMNAVMITTTNDDNLYYNQSTVNYGVKIQIITLVNTCSYELSAYEYMQRDLPCLVLKCVKQ